MKQIRLPRGEWSYDPNAQLGAEGGFGIVFEGTAEGSGPLAVKKLKIKAQDAAHREFRIADDLVDRELGHVIPVFDAGQDAESDSYFVVMPRAEKSLQNELDSGKTWNDAEAAAILLEIAEGLSEVTDIVHRDLKPANVLYHEGKWKVADFGIARFVEESTSPHTLKGCLTPPYAAPEQWRLEHSTGATDIYALGCIGYALLTGKPPFPGPSREEYHDQHLHAKPPRLDQHDPQLRTLLTMMLRKLPQARPGLDRVKELLGKISERPPEPSSRRGLEALAHAGAQVAQRQAEEETRREKQRAKEEARERLAEEAFEILDSIIQKLFKSITDVAPAATCGEPMTDPQIQLGGATLEIHCQHGLHAISEGSFPRSGWDVVAGAWIRVTQRIPFRFWSASLWYKLGTDNTYRWNEVIYFFAPGGQGEMPRALQNKHEADDAAADVGLNKIAWGPQPIDGEDADDFCERWAGLLAKASRGQLSHPRNLPLPSDYFDN